MKANHWVDPSFTDLPEDAASLSGKRKASRSTTGGQQGARKRRMERSRHAPHREPASRDQDTPWVDRHAPLSLAELAVHKKKVEEVENWLRTNSLKGGVLLLTGPSGSGKTATVRVLSLEMGLTIQEWSNPSNPEPFSSTEHDWRMNGFPSSSQLSQFQEFLLRANKYNCLKMAGDRGASDRKLILVEDIPNLFYRQPAQLHDALRRFVKTSRCPLVFIVSDSLSGDSSSRFLFPRATQEELNVSSISFNPLPPTTMMKVLSGIAALEAGKRGARMLDPAALESLCSGSAGDIRSAINSLQFSSLQDAPPDDEPWRTKSRAATSALSRTKPRKKKTAGQAMEWAEPRAIGGKDAALFLFRALGKILHCKRGNPGGGDCVTEACGAALPPHLSRHHREELQIDPEVVFERSHMSGEFFNLYLHQNYLDFFSQVEDVDRASEYLSDADLLTADWTSRGIMGDYGCSVATRGLLHSNSQQVSVGFRPLHKPSWLLVNKKFRENCLAAQSLFRSFCVTPVSLQTELLPYLAKLSNPMRNQAQITFIQDVGQISLRRFPARLTLETLTDKEPGHLEEEEEEEEEEGQDGAEESLPASQPQPGAAPVPLEEVLIEEYSSD